MLKKSYPYIKVFLFLIGVFSIPAIFIAGFYEDEIIDKALSSINGSIGGDIHYGQADIQLLKNFPHIDAVLQNPELALGQDTLMMGDQMSISLDLISVLTGSYKIHAVNLIDCHVNILLDKDGQLNLSDFFSAPDSNSESGDTDLTISKIVLDNVVINYYDSITQNRVTIAQVNGQVNCALKDNLLNSELKLDNGIVEQLILSKKRYSTGQKLKAEGRINYGIQSKKLNFNPNFQLQLGKFQTKLNGSIAFNNQTDYDLKLNEVNTELRNLYYQIPREYQQIFSKYVVSGKYSGSITVKGKSSSKLLPKISLNGHLEIPKISLIDNSVLLENIKTDLKLTAGPDLAGKSFNAQFKNFSTSSPYGTFSGSWRYTDLTKGILNAQLHGDADMRSLNSILPATIKIHNGTAKIQNLLVRDYPVNTDKSIVEHMELLCAISNAHIDYGNIPLKGSCPQVSVNGGRLDFKGLNIANKSSDLEGDLSAQTTDSNWDINADLKSSHLDLDELLIQYESTKPSTVSTTNKHTSEPRVSVVWKHSIDELIIKEVSYQNFNINYIESYNQFETKFTTELANGAAVVEATGTRKNGINSVAKIKLSEVDAYTLFSDYKNFEQEFIKSDHISGRIDAYMTARLNWDNHYNFVHNQADISAYSTIRDGTLSSFMPLQQFKKYISLDLLQKIEFNEMSNYFAYKNEELFIPAMLIQNNACNFYVSGFQNTSGRIHYNLLVHAEQALMRKLGRKQEGILPSHQAGWLNLYYNIDGTTTDFNYKSDKELVLRGFDYGDKVKEQLRAGLAREFGHIPDMNQAPEWFQSESLEDGLIPSTQGELEYIRNF